MTGKGGRDDPGGARRRRWSTARKVLLAAGGLLVLWTAMGLPYSFYGRRTVLFCRECGTERTEEVHRLFAWSGPRIPFTTDVDAIRPSHALADFFGPNHEHRWGAYPGPAVRQGLLTATQCGSFPMGTVLERYENDPLFRDRARRALEAGTISRDDLKALFDLRKTPYRPGGSGPPVPPEAVVARTEGFLRAAAPWGSDPFPWELRTYLPR